MTEPGLFFFDGTFDSTSTGYGEYPGSGWISGWLQEIWNNLLCSCGGKDRVFCTQSWVELEKPMNHEEHEEEQEKKKFVCGGVAFMLVMALMVELLFACNPFSSGVAFTANTCANSLLFDELWDAAFQNRYQLFIHIFIVVRDAQTNNALIFKIFAEFFVHFMSMGLFHDKNIFSPKNIIDTQGDFSVVVQAGRTNLPSFVIEEYGFCCWAPQFILTAYKKYFFHRFLKSIEPVCLVAFKVGVGSTLLVLFSKLFGPGDKGSLESPLHWVDGQMDSRPRHLRARS